MDRWCIHPALDGLRLLNTKISLVQTIGQYELPGMKTRGGQSIVRARGHAVTRMGRGATRVDGADHGRRGGGGNRRKKISVLFWVNDPVSHISHRKSVRNEGNEVVTRKEKMLTIFPELVRLEELNAPRGAARSPQ